mgnify:CR=1 FL=1
MRSLSFLPCRICRSPSAISTSAFCSFRASEMRSPQPYTVRNRAGKGKDFGPRIHDLRHTMVCHNIRSWVEAGIPISSRLPILSKYLGHKSIVSTQWYLRLTADLYPHLVDAELPRSISSHARKSSTTGREIWAISRRSLLIPRSFSTNRRKSSSVSE